MIEPPIWSFIRSEPGLDPGDDPKGILKKLCVKCYIEPYYYTVFVIECLIAFIGFIFLLWIMWSSFRKFARDGAQLAEEEDGNQIGFDDIKVNNRVGKTFTKLFLRKESNSEK